MNRLYLMEAGELLLQQNYDSAFVLLDKDRQERVTRMKQEKNKALCMAAGLLPAYALQEFQEPSVITRVSVEQVLKALKDREPIKLIKKKKGKPYFQDFPDVYFNLSHSGDYVACVVSDREVGVDIQEYREIKNKALADKILHEEEWVLCRAESARKESTRAESVREESTRAESARKGSTQAESMQKESAGSGHLQQEQLLQLWAAKEAFVKCTGDGLSKDFKELCVDFAAGEVMDTKTGKRLQLMMSDVLEGYAVAVCMEK